MTANRRESIRDFANRVREHLEIPAEEENLNLKEIVEKLEGEIRNVPDDWEIKYDKVTKEDDPNFIIWIDDRSVYPRQRFSIAHEIGHLLIHMGYRTNKQTWDKLKKGDGFHRLPLNNSPVEMEASEFAASFLMPKELFIKVANESGDDEFYCTNEIAERFGVSEDAASYRGRLLDLWE